MKCPTCRTITLKPTRLDGNLAAMGCSQCGGALITLLYYRDWAERHTVVAKVSHYTAVEKIETDNHKGALSCPKCSRIMTKYHISGAVDNQIDLCGQCDEAWLDRGEWEMLGALDMDSHMPQLFTESWQRKVRKEKADQSRKVHFERTLGHEALHKADEFKIWLVGQPKREEIMLYLRLALEDS